MSQHSLAQQKALAQAEKQAQLALLAAKNKEAAKVHLLAMQCLLVRMSTR